MFKPLIIGISILTFAVGFIIIYFSNSQEPQSSHPTIDFPNYVTPRSSDDLSPILKGLKKLQQNQVALEVELAGSKHRYLEEINELRVSYKLKEIASPALPSNFNPQEILATTETDIITILQQQHSLAAATEIKKKINEIIKPYADRLTRSRESLHSKQDGVKRAITNMLNLSEIKLENNSSIWVSNTQMNLTTYETLSEEDQPTNHLSPIKPLDNDDEKIVNETRVNTLAENMKEVNTLMVEYKKDQKTYDKNTSVIMMKLRKARSDKAKNPPNHANNPSIDKDITRLTKLLNGFPKPTLNEYNTALQKATIAADEATKAKRAELLKNKNDTIEYPPDIANTTDIKDTQKIITALNSALGTEWVFSLPSPDDWKIISKNRSSIRGFTQELNEYLADGSTSPSEKFSHIKTAGFRIVMKKKIEPN